MLFYLIDDEQFDANRICDACDAAVSHFLLWSRPIKPEMFVTELYKSCIITSSFWFLVFGNGNNSREWMKTFRCSWPYVYMFICNCGVQGGIKRKLSGWADSDSNSQLFSVRYSLQLLGCPNWTPNYHCYSNKGNECKENVLACRLQSLLSLVLSFLIKCE